MGAGGEEGDVGSRRVWMEGEAVWVLGHESVPPPTASTPRAGLPVRAQPRLRLCPDGPSLLSFPWAQGPGEAQGQRSEPREGCREAPRRAVHLPGQSQESSCRHRRPSTQGGQGLRGDSELGDLGQEVASGLKLGGLRPLLQAWHCPRVLQPC